MASVHGTMSHFLLISTGFILITVAVGLIRLLRGPSSVDRLMAAQLFATGGIAVLLLLASAVEVPSAVDVALTLAILAAFTPVAFVKGDSRAENDFKGNDK